MEASEVTVEDLNAKSETPILVSPLEMISIINFTLFRMQIHIILLAFVVYLWPWSVL